jgi:hypothetical protein
MNPKTSRRLISLLFAAAQITSCAPTIVSNAEATITPGVLEATLHLPSCHDATFKIDGDAITLVAGFSAMETAPGSAAKITTQYFGNDTLADLNGDGEQDCAFILTQETGGSGRFYYLVAALRSGKGYQGTNGIFLGDRIDPLTISTTAGTITVNYADRKPDEPFTNQPSVNLTKHIKLVDGILSG